MSFVVCGTTPYCPCQCCAALVLLLGKTKGVASLSRYGVCLSHAKGDLQGAFVKIWDFIKFRGFLVEFLSYRAGDPEKIQKIARKMDFYNRNTGRPEMITFQNSQNNF